MQLAPSRPSACRSEGWRSCSFLVDHIDLFCKRIHRHRRAHNERMKPAAPTPSSNSSAHGRPDIVILCGDNEPQQRSSTPILDVPSEESTPERPAASTIKSVADTVSARRLYVDGEEAARYLEDYLEVDDDHKDRSAASSQPLTPRPPTCSDTAEPATTTEQVAPTPLPRPTAQSLATANGDKWAREYVAEN